MRRTNDLAALLRRTAATALLRLLGVAARAADRPNILVIWGDDIGIWNVSRYSLGQMGYQTPNIDRIANEGVMFTDAYGEQSCTAGRSAFITGQHPVRTGLTKVGVPGAPLGLRPEDPTLSELLRPLGYTSGQFGKKPKVGRAEGRKSGSGREPILPPVRASSLHRFLTSIFSGRLASRPF